MILSDLSRDDFWELYILLNLYQIVHICRVELVQLRICPSVEITACPSRPHNIGLWSRFLGFWPFVNIELKVAFFDGSIWEEHLPVTVLDSFLPLTLVDTGISPLHLTIAISFIIFVLSFVDIPTGPSENTKSMLLVETVVPFVLIALWSFPTLPSSLTMLQPILELSNVEGPILPGVLSFAFGLSILVLTGVNISVSKDIGALTVLQTAFPLPLIPVSVFPSVHSVAFSLGMSPLSNVGIIVESSPNSIAMLKSLVPFSVVDLSVAPGVDSLAVSFTCLELPIVRVIVWVPFKSPPTPQIVFPFTFELSSILVPHDSFSISLPIDNLAFEDCIRVLPFYVASHISQYFYVYLLRLTND